MPRARPKRKGSTARLRETGQFLNAQRRYERYVELARAKALTGDYVAAENYLQHAEHYLRSMQARQAPDPLRK
ncbi:DUF4167 domain-containing protein [Bradyrhizobium macuxiense]|uniref:DUF4167 domain-containing protein n=1 Tax=Bradyrhizobium macuxiense TaxID=1755647 RepID=UPI0009EB020E|nr:DUF4167 domain-containing protein [Bradyrhizobium macuxiense]